MISNLHDIVVEWSWILQLVGVKWLKWLGLRITLFSFYKNTRLIFPQNLSTN